MERFRRILVAVDLGKAGDRVTAGSRRAMERAAWIARREQASLTLLHSERPDEYWDADANGFVPSRDGARERRAVLDAALADLRASVPEVRSEIRSETAWLAIIREVLQEGFDVVVAGKRTDVESDDRKLGTVARKLLRKCPCAVWLEDPRPSEDPSVIVAAADLSPVGERVIALAASVAHAFGAELHIVHAYSLSLEAQLASTEERREYERDQHQKAMAQIARTVQATPMAGRATLHVGLTSPAQAILESVEVLRPGLVVMGTISRGGIPGVLIGNTAERLIDRLDCALLTVKPEDFICPVTLPEGQ